MRFLQAKMAFKQAAYAVCLIIFAPIASVADEPRLSIPTNVEAPIRIKLGEPLGPTPPNEVLKVFVGAPDTCCEGKTPIAGTYGVDDQTMTFKPTFPFLLGQAYTVQTQLDAGNQLAITRATEFSIGAKAALNAPKVTAIYPSGPSIPENVLRFYIHFSKPMMPHMSERFIDLINAQGETDEAAFMSFKQELWNADRTRLTLLMDPGRIKRGVAHNRELGPALLAGQSYSLAVRVGWPAALGGTTNEMVKRNFNASAPLRSLPDPELWEIDMPKRDTKDALTVNFDRQFDRYMALSSISIVDGNGKAIAGDTSLEDHEMTWRFHPKTQWLSSSIEIRVDARMEDVAGNNFKELLDHSLGTVPKAHEQITMRFELKN